MKKRATLDTERFSISALSRSELIDNVHGVQDIKLFNLYKERILKWKNIQYKYLKIRIKLLKLSQIQRAGSIGINRIKDTIIILLTSTSVIKGDMTLGQMLAVQYILGQLNGPIRDFVNYIQSTQDTKLSIERLGDYTDKIYKEPFLNNREFQSSRNIVESLVFENVTISKNENTILENININIPYGTKVGIVGESGSGKTTIINTIMNYEDITHGGVYFGKSKIDSYSHEERYSNFSAVLHDTYIFSDTIKYNITLTNKIDFKRLNKILNICLLDDIVNELPYKLKTKIGKGNSSLSQGQKQRIIIARALYKNFNYLFLDEFTNALDNITRKLIVKNIYEYCKNKTIISIAHNIKDLDYVDYIFCIKKGKIIEKGTPKELFKKGSYFSKLYTFEI